MNIYIEGNIGTGKSTFLEFLKNNLGNNNCSYIQEPVDQWIALKDSQGKNILEYFYEDQDKWSFAFQMNSFISRIKKIEDHKKEINLIERSVYTDRYCFALNCFNEGKMSEIEYNIYCKWHDWLCNRFPVKPRGLIYLKNSATECDRRIKERSRNAESGIPLDYLEKLNILHDTWLNKESNVLEIELEYGIYENKEKMDEILKKIKCFIKQVCECPNTNHI